MTQRREQQKTDVKTRICSSGTDWEGLFRDANELGAARFGTLWLTATQNAVATFREAGLGDEIERDYRLRAALSRALFRALYAATNHPNNLARAKERAKVSV